MAKARKKKVRTSAKVSPAKKTAGKVKTSPPSGKTSSGGVRGSGSGVRERRRKVAKKKEASRKVKAVAQKAAPAAAKTKSVKTARPKVRIKAKARPARVAKAPVEVKASPSAATEGAAAPAATYLDHGAPLPVAYGENRVVAIARDPEHVFIYWDVASDVRVADRPLMLRIFCVDDDASFEFHPPPDAGNWYFQVTPERTYRFELLARDPDGGWSLLARSRDARTPVRLPPGRSAEPPQADNRETPQPLTRVIPPRLPALQQAQAALPPETPLPARAAWTAPLTPPATLIPDTRSLATLWPRRARDSAPLPGPRSPVPGLPLPARRAPVQARSSSVHAEPLPRRASSPAPAPVPVPAPVETIFAAQYAQGGTK